MRSITGTDIVFSSVLEGRELFAAWKKTRADYVRVLGQKLLICSEAEILRIFDKWEAQLEELEKSDRGHNYLTALLTISLLHYFNRSYDQIKEHVPFISRMFEHKSRVLICVAARVFRWLARERPENVDFIRDLVAMSASKWILAASTRFAALQILRTAGTFILPNVFEVTSKNIQLLWNAATSEDVDLRITAAEVFDVHLRGMPKSSVTVCVDKVFRECMRVMASREPSNHGCVLICRSLMKLHQDLINVPELMNALLEEAAVKSEVLVSASMELLLDIAQTMSHLFTPDTLELMFKHLIAACQRYVTSKKLYWMIEKFACAFNPLLVPVQMILEFLRQVVKQQKYRQQHCVAFLILKKIFVRFKDVSVPPSFFLDAEPSPAYLKALKRRMTLLREVKPTLIKCYHEGVNAKATQTQTVLSLSILKAFGQHLFKDKDEVYHQICGFAKSQHEEVRLLVARILPIFTNPESVDDLLYLALLDESKFVRATAVSQLKKPLKLNHSQMLTQTLSDSSYKVKRNAVTLIASMAPLNPMSFHVPIVSFVQQTILSVASSSNPRVCAKISTLLPLIASSFLKFCPAFIPQVVHVCFSFLDSGAKQNTTVYKNGKIKIQNVIHRDTSHDGHALISKSLPFDQNCTNLLRIFQIENQEYIEKRDANLLATLASLAEHLSPFLADLIPIFVRIFSSVRSNHVYLNALEALTQIGVTIPEAASVPKDHPDLVPVLMVLLKSKPSEEVAIKILKLMGSFGVTLFPRSFVDNPADSTPTTALDFKSSSFNTDFVMTLLLRLINEPHSSIFEAITSVFVKEADFAAKFLQPIVTAFVKAIGSAKGQQKEKMFHQLEIIAYFSASKMEPFAHEIVPCVIRNVGMKQALRLACVLSYFLKTEFILHVQPLFGLAVRQMDVGIEDLKYLETLMAFLTHAIVLQNQPLEVFLDQCDQTLSEQVSPEYVVLILDAITTIVQLGDASFQCSTITRLCIRLLKWNASAYRENVFQLLCSLAVYCRVSVDFIQFAVQNEKLSHPTIELLRDFLNNRANGNDHFLVHHSLSVNISIPDYVPLEEPSTFNVFESIPAPQFGNTAKWLEDLCSTVVQNSPYISIRGCLKIVKHSRTFRSDIFPMAFLSCWRSAKANARQSFSKVIQSIFETESYVDPVFLRLAELLERSGHPLHISNFIIASACHSPAQALRFLVKHFRENPKDYKAIELMLTLNMRLGRINSSRGILKTVNLKTAGAWYEELGDWESALKIYQETGESDVGSIVRCYARLERWAEIRAMIKAFDAMPSHEKKKNAIWFAWAFYRVNDLQRVSYFVNRFTDNEDIDTMVFKEIFLVASEQYNLAKTGIDESFRALVKDCSIYSALNANQVDENLMFANNLVELEEALKLKKSLSQAVPKIWTRRLRCLTGDSFSWMRVVEIRNLVVNPSGNKKSYLKLMAVLIKERRWALVDAFWKGLFDSIHEPVVQIAWAKMLWARDRKREAIESIHIMNLIYDNQLSSDALDKEISELSEAVRENLVARVYRHKGMRKKLVPKVRSRLLRIEGEFRLQLYQKNEGMESILNTITLFERAVETYPQDYRNWAGFAFAASRALGDTSFVSKAISGFLKVTQLRTVNNLEYLCHLFSLLFRYGGTVKIPDDIVVLSPEVVSEILPQIVCQINHKDAGVRRVVHELLVRFGENHFQALVFPLHLVIGSEDKQKRAIASDLLHNLSMKHRAIAEEADLFVDGLLRSAVTWYEMWMTRLDSAFIESQRSYEEGTKMLKSLFDTRHHPKCKMDEMFVRCLEAPLTTCANTIAHFTSTEGSFKALWFQLKRFYEILRDRFKKLETIELGSVSEQLAAKQDFVLAVPGAYVVNGKTSRIKKIDPVLPILKTQQHPRLLYMTDIEGVRWKFLLKGNEDLRLDQRIMQFFGLINVLLTSNKLTSALHVTISKYAIIPFAPNAGLISWVTGADTLHQLVTDFRKANGIPTWVENEMYSAFVGDGFDYLNSLQKHEVWDLIAPKCPATEFRDIIWERTKDAVSWLRYIDSFVLSTALMSMAGYIVGLGDRHPSNIMIQRQTGHVIHIDFGDSFETALNRERMPEKVPFRLTRMLVKAFGVSGVEGQFRAACEAILRVLRDNGSSLIAQLEIFVHEPIFCNKDRRMSAEGRSTILDRVIAKLSGQDPQPEREEMTVETQVDKLIAIAADPYRYVNHYIGWCQFW